MNDNKIPCGYEIDPYYASTCLVLFSLSYTPSFNTDPVDVNFDNNTSIFLALLSNSN